MKTQRTKDIWNNPTARREESRRRAHEMSGRSQLIKALLEATGTQVDWTRLQAHDLYNESDAICRLADEWDTKSIFKYWTMLKASGHTASDLDRSDSDLAVRIDGLMSKIGFDKIAEAVANL